MEIYEGHFAQGKPEQVSSCWNYLDNRQEHGIRDQQEGS